MYFIIYFVKLYTSCIKTNFRNKKNIKKKCKTNPKTTDSLSSLSTDFISNARTEKRFQNRFLKLSTKLCLIFPADSALSGEESSCLWRVRKQVSKDRSCPNWRTLTIASSVKAYNTLILVSNINIGFLISKTTQQQIQPFYVSGGYYMIERKMLKLQIVVLNTNLMKKSDNDDEATEQWKWLNTVLEKFQRNGETVSFHFNDHYVGEKLPVW